MEAIPSASYSFTLRVEFPHRVGSLGRLLATPGALALLADTRTNPAELLARHQEGSCGNRTPR